MGWDRRKRRAKRFLTLPYDESALCGHRETGKVLSTLCWVRLRPMPSLADVTHPRPASTSSYIVMTTIPARLATLSTTSSSIAEARKRSLKLYRAWYRSVSPAGGSSGAVAVSIQLTFACRNASSNH
jgi:hypothetical protein